MSSSVTFTTIYILLRYCSIADQLTNVKNRLTNVNSSCQKYRALHEAQSPIILMPQPLAWQSRSVSYAGVSILYRMTIRYMLVLLDAPQIWSGLIARIP